MNKIKIIEGLANWEVMKRASEGEPVAYRGAGDKVWNRCAMPSWDFVEYNFAIIDISEPEINWKEFNWEFFNQYGGLTILDQGVNNSHLMCTPRAEYGEEIELRESPFYYWPGGECPVPGNVEVEVTKRDCTTSTGEATIYAWDYNRGIVDGADIISFRLTGNVVND